LELVEMLAQLVTNALSGALESAAKEAKLIGG
jgi:hypothetical protein